MKSRVLVHGMILLTLGTFLFSCTSGSEMEKREVSDAVNRYNSMLRRAYLEANLDLMADVATSNQLNKLFPVMQSLRSRNNSMVALQETFELRKVSVRSDKAVVNTKEEWIYWWQNAFSGEVTKPRQPVTYIIKYRLIKEDGIWKVDSIEDIG